MANIFRPLFQVIPPLLLILLALFPAAGKAEELQMTPLVYQVLGGNNVPVQGSDGEYHLVYEIWLTNVSPQTWTLERVEAIGEAKRRVFELKGTELQARMGSLNTRGGSQVLGPNQTAMVWMHLKFPARQDIPKALFHRFSLAGAGKTLGLAGAEMSVSSEVAAEIRAPLRGGNWLAGDGCCDSIRHVRAVLPINGRLYLGQRFAIDWEKLGPGNKIYSGDAKNPENYFCYGQEVLAVADGEVVGMLDGQTNQVPGKLPEGMDVALADGNHIILKLAPGRFALYAHLKPDSIRVKVGDRVKAGQVLAQVGNTGNTSEPHLHFQLMDGPSALASNGLPYVISSFELMGRAPSTEAFDKSAATGTALEILPTKNQGQHELELPLDLSLVRFAD